MRGQSFGAMIILCIGVVAIVAMIFGRDAPPHEQARSPVAVIVVPAAPPTASAIPQPASMPDAFEAPVDTIAIAPYRAIVSRALGRDAAAVYRGIVVANSQQRIVCGDVWSRADHSFRAFVFVGAAGIAALADGSAEFRGMQAGACHQHF